MIDNQNYPQNLVSQDRSLFHPSSQFKDTVSQTTGSQKKKKNDLIKIYAVLIEWFYESRFYVKATRACRTDRG